ncbi:hypothetical protein CP533_3887 [Ophiocordyceps camponoti-saundersi (nom. inval.)]|nr:hypothetical protein CP533_3887 [Ophiocordyceps camponoti-saundersi (nom. inval.)]
MAEEQKPVVDAPEAVKVEAPAVEQPALSETAPVAATEAKVTDETKPTEATEAAEAPKDVKKDELKSVEEGYLAHKAQGASFPKNLIPSKEFFFFGSDAIEPKHLAHYQKTEKSTDVAHENIAWASHTGKGLLFLGDKKAPHGVINLANASDPEVDGSHKFHFTSKGNKHSFKANSTPERDSWIAQLKLKIAEAKELASSVTESEAYKKTHETFKPVPATAVPVKDDKPVEDAAKTDEPAKAEETPKEGEAAKDDVKDEEPKRRSASRKRASFFAFGGGKKEEKKDEAKAEAAPAVAAAASAAEPATEAEETPAAEAATEDAVPTAESPKEKPAPPKRNSFFGGVFSKKEKKPADSKAVDEAPEATTESELPTTTDATAPVIPPVESTTPLAVDVPSTTAAPTETAEATAANSEAKKDTKEKRKSSLPFAFGKRDKSPVPAEGEDKAGMSAFSKLRATIKGKSAAKPDDKVTEEGVKEEAAAAAAAETKKDTSAEAAHEASSAAPEASAPEAENKPENVASATPAVTAAA